MILSTHAVGGAAAAALGATGPAGAFLLGILSHFLLDTIPHWHYPLLSRERSGDGRMSERLDLRGRRFLRDILVTGLECGLGFALALLAAYSAGADLALVFWGAVGGVLPDFLQLVYHVFPRSPLLHLQRFHKWIHAREDLDDRPLLAIGSQAVFFLIFLWLITL